MFLFQLILEKFAAFNKNETVTRFDETHLENISLKTSDQRCQVVSRKRNILYPFADIDQNE